MESIQAQLERAHTMTAVVVDGVGDDQWTLSTPCAAWTVSALTNHLVGGYRLFAAAINQVETTAAFEQDWLGRNPKKSYLDAANEVLTAWQTPGALQRPVGISIGVVPGDLGALIHLTEVVVHGIDLAVSTMQEQHIDEESARHLLSTMREGGMMDRFRVRGVFEAERAAVANAPSHRRLMAFLGRPTSGSAMEGASGSWAAGTHEYF